MTSPRWYRFDSHPTGNMSWLGRSIPASVYGITSKVAVSRPIKVIVTRNTESLVALPSSVLLLPLLPSPFQNNKMMMMMIIFFFAGGELDPAVFLCRLLLFLLRAPWSCRDQRLVSLSSGTSRARSSSKKFPPLRLLLLLLLLLPSLPVSGQTRAISTSLTKTSSCPSIHIPSNLYLSHAVLIERSRSGETKAESTGFSIIFGSLLILSQMMISVCQPFFFKKNQFIFKKNFNLGIFVNNRTFYLSI